MNISKLSSGLIVTGLLMVGCQKVEIKPDQTALSDEEKNLIVAAGFNGNWAEKSSNGYLIEGDIYLSKSQLQEMSGKGNTHNFVVANEEHYRTTNIVSTPSSGARTITVAMGAGFPSYYYTALDNALARYNSYNLKINFTKVSSGADITVSAADLGTSNGGCILGRASGFPTASGNPSPGFTLSNSSCATTYISTVAKADEVIAHEIGHCIGFRHTDYVNRISCGGGGGEGASTVGAIWIPGTPKRVNGNYDSWMMACTNGNPNFNSDDGVALNTVY